MRLMQLDSGSVRVSFKRITLEPSADDQKSKKKKTSEPEPVCLVRATYGKTKISTTVAFKDHVRFQQQFGLIMKVHTTGLATRDKRKQKAKQKQKRKPKSRSQSERD